MSSRSSLPPPQPIYLKEEDEEDLSDISDVEEEDISDMEEEEEDISDTEEEEDISDVEEEEVKKFKITVPKMLATSAVVKEITGPLPEKQISSEKIRDMKISGIPSVDPIKVNYITVKLAPPIITAANIGNVNLPDKAYKTFTEKRVIKALPKKKKERKTIIKDETPEENKRELSLFKLEKSIGVKSRGRGTDTYNVNDLNYFISKINALYDNINLQKGGIKNKKIETLINFLKSENIQNIML